LAKDVVAEALVQGMKNGGFLFTAAVLLFSQLFMRFGMMHNGAA
jgi:hypothetical protein